MLLTSDIFRLNQINLTQALKESIRLDNRILILISVNWFIYH